ncbi:MAG: YceD family protein, partial [Patescibacteria group bacterium]|nr:YceD family protein [Patescibacteria group bacterium]
MRNDLPKIILNLTNFLHNSALTKLNKKINLRLLYQDERFKITKPITGNVSIKKEQKNLVLIGHIKTEIMTCCDRCLKEINLKIKTQFERLLNNMTNANNEIQLSKNNQIDLFPIIWEEIITMIPTKILCKKNCQGLCPICGINFNQKTCSHYKKIKQKPKNPFSAL